MIEWLIDAFEPRKYPWFRDEFVPPALFRSDLLSNPVFQEAIGWRPPDEKAI